MPQDMSRAFLMTLERLAFITVLVISRMIDSIRLDSTDSRIGSKLSALMDRPPAGLALTLVAKLMGGASSSASSGGYGKSARCCDHGCRPRAPVQFPFDRLCSDAVECYASRPIVVNHRKIVSGLNRKQCTHRARASR